MNLYKSVIIGLFLGALVSCAITIGNTRFIPHYDGVDLEIAPYVDMWLDLAKEHGITFDKVVTVGFTNIANHYIVGQTYYQDRFREIDIDIEYWKRVGIIDRTVLIFHELTHAYCYRDHDYGPGKKYGSVKEIERKPPLEGMFKDGCPLSIMFPIVIDRNCFLSHYQEYVDEMFDHCEPY